MAHKIDSASGSITLISEDGSGNVNLTLPRAGLGTAASADTGTAAGNIPVLDGSGQIASGVLTNAAVADNAITLAKMAHGTDGELITYDATGAPANVAVGTSGQVLTSGGAGVAPTFQTAAGGGGKVLQVVQTTATTTTSGIGTTFTSIGMSVSITPSATSSKILLMFSTGGYSASNINAVRFRIKRDTTVVRLITRYGLSSDLSNNIHLPIAVTYLDSPSTTSSITYSAEMATEDGSGVTINGDGAAGTDPISVIAMEIGA